MNEETIKIEEFEYTENLVRYSYILRLKTSFFGRLKFLFKGYKSKFEIPFEVMKGAEDGRIYRKTGRKV